MINLENTTVSLATLIKIGVPVLGIVGSGSVGIYSVREHLKSQAALERRVMALECELMIRRCDGIFAPVAAAVAVSPYAGGMFEESIAEAMAADPAAEEAAPETDPQ